MKYGIIGTGAIGGYYGSKLAYSGKDVHFLLHRDYDIVREKGLKVLSCDGDFSITSIHAYKDVKEMPLCDVVLVGLKSVNNGLLAHLLPPLLKENTLVILIQNGIGLEADLQIMFPKLSIAAGLAFICSSKTEPGIIRHECYGSINIGNYSCKDNVKLQAVIDDFIHAGVKAALVEYHEARWKKAVWNMPFNGMTVALNTTTDQLLSNPETERLIHDQMLEVIHAAQHLGVENIHEQFADKMIQMTRQMVPYSPSMKLDFDFRRPMEIDYLYTKPIKEAQIAGFSMPKLEMLEGELRFIQRRYLSIKD